MYTKTLRGPKGNRVTFPLPKAEIEIICVEFRIFVISSTNDITNWVLIFHGNTPSTSYHKGDEKIAFLIFTVSVSMRCRSKYLSTGISDQSVARTGGEEIGPENDPANFLSVLLTNRYSVNMAEPQQTGWHSPPEDNNFRISHMFLSGEWCEIYTASRGICNESVDANLIRHTFFFSSIFSLWCSSWKIFVLKFVGLHARAWGSVGLLNR